MNYSMFVPKLLTNTNNSTKFTEMNLTRILPEVVKIQSTQFVVTFMKTDYKEIIFTVHKGKQVTLIFCKLVRNLDNSTDYQVEKYSNDQENNIAL